MDFTLLLFSALLAITLARPHGNSESDERPHRKHHHKHHHHHHHHHPRTRSTPGTDTPVTTQENPTISSVTTQETLLPVVTEESSSLIPVTIEGNPTTVENPITSTAPTDPTEIVTAVSIGKVTAEPPGTASSVPRTTETRLSSY